MKVSGEFKAAAKLDRLPIPASGKEYWRDAGTTGLYLSVSKTGRRSWECQLKVAGKVRWRTLGQYVDGKDGMSLKDARELAGAARKRSLAGLDPWPESDISMFKDAWARFEKTEGAGWRNGTRLVYAQTRRDIGTRWDRRKLGLIERTDIASFYDELNSRSRQRQAHSNLLRFFAWAVDARGIIDASPVPRKAPVTPGNYPLVGAYLYGTEKATPLGYSVHPLYGKSVRGGYTGNSGRVKFSEAHVITVRAASAAPAR